MGKENYAAAHSLLNPASQDWVTRRELEDQLGPLVKARPDRWRSLRTRSQRLGHDLRTSRVLCGVHLGNRRFDYSTLRLKKVDGTWRIENPLSLESLLEQY